MGESIWDRMGLVHRRDRPSGMSGVSWMRDWMAKKFLTWRVAVASAAALMFWGYISVKILVFDVDRYLLAELIPSYLWLLEYRFAASLLVLVFVAFTARRLWPWLIYVALFPVLLPLVWFPYALYRAGVWHPAIALANAIYGLKCGLRFTVLSRVVELLSLVVVAVSGHARGAMVGIALLLFLCLARTTWRTVCRAFRSDRFIRSQVGLAQMCLESPSFEAWASVPESIKRSRARRFNRSQIHMLTTSLANGLVTIKAVSFYAYQLDRYFRGAFPSVMALISYVSLYVYSLIVLSAVNLAI
jgi:hypothetical protein